MVQITSVVLAALLIAPSLAVPVINGQQFDAREDALVVREPSSEYDVGVELSERDIEGIDLSERDLQELEELIERDPSFFKKAFKKIKKIAKPALLGKVAGVAGNFIREDFELSERDLQDLEELIERDPSFFKKAFKKIKKIANPANLSKVAGVASNFIREEDWSDLSERDLEDLEAVAELAARDPNFFKKAFKKIKKIAKPAVLGKVAGIAGNFIREDVISERDIADLEELEELVARDPNFFKKAFKKIKKIAKPAVLGKVAGIAGNFIREDELEALEELLARDPSFFKKAFKKIKKIAKPAVLGKVAGIAGNFIREDAAEVQDLLEREFDEFDELD